MKLTKAFIITNFIFGLLSATAFAAAVTPVDVKKQLNIPAGDYQVTAVDDTAKATELCTGLTMKWSAEESEKLCTLNAIHTVRWADDGAMPILGIGQARSYSDFNSGLITDPKQSAKDSCTYSHNTQTVSGRLIDDTYSNCAGENTSTHAEITVKPNVLEYSQVTKVSKAGKVICLPLKCTLTNSNLKPLDGTHQRLQNPRLIESMARVRDNL